MYLSGKHDQSRIKQDQVEIDHDLQIPKTAGGAAGGEEGQGSVPTPTVLTVGEQRRGPVSMGQTWQDHSGWEEAGRVAEGWGGG